MKKILIVIFIMLLLTGTASAKITKEVDKFNGDVEIQSKNYFDGTYYLITKTLKDDHSNILLMVAKSNKEWWFFSKTPFEFKINDQILKTETPETISSMGNYPYLNTGAIVIVNDELQEKIITYKNITMRYHFIEKPDVTLDIPDSILTEWKEVINSTKDWKEIR